MFGRQALQQPQVGNVHLPGLKTVHQKRIIDVPPIAPAVALHDADDIAGIAATDGDEWRQSPWATHPRHYGAEVWLHSCRTFQAPRQRTGSRLQMTAMEILVGANEGKQMAMRCQSRQQFGKANARDARGNGAEGPAILRRGIRLGIAGIQVARCSPQPDQQH
ncbi:hypothetical protein HRbin36_02760 [bacterium HR36]|nr:hypothetical protein HRbin36_02760 [bacterium HR36]